MKNNFALPLILMALVAGWMGCFVWPVIQHDRVVRQQTSCQSSLRQLGLAMQMYYIDASDTLPPVAGSTTGKFGWAGALSAYVKDRQAFQCANAPSPPTSFNPRSVGYTDYWMNQRLDGIRLLKLSQPSSTILFGEGNDGTDATDARYALDRLPAAWRDNESSPARRHRWGANYVYVDGHAKSREPGAIEEDARPDGSRISTFAVK